MKNVINRALVAKKKLSFIIVLALTLCACNKNVTPEPSSLPADSLLTHVLRAIIDTNQSCIDVKDEFYMFLDTLQMQVETYPDEDIRIGAKSLAMDLCGLFLYGDCCSPEEMRFFYDSLLLRLMAVPETWYCPFTSQDEIGDYYNDPVLTQNVVFRYGDDEQNHIIYIDLYFMPDNKEGIAITLPMEAEYLASVMFNGEEMSDIDTSATFNLMNAYNVVDKSEDLGQMIAFGKEFIDAMLTHDGMYIAYIGCEESDEIKDRFHDSHLRLDKFHEQYNMVKELLNR